MRKIIVSFKVFIFSALFVSCSSYQLASYYSDNDGIYVSNERGTDYEVVFKDLADESLLTNSIDTDSGNLPWGANPDSREVVNNFFPSFGRFYLDPFSYNMGYNPFFSNNGSFINYGFRSPFFYNSFAYNLGYPFYGPMNFYFSPYATSLGNYYWYMMRHSRNYPWYNGGMYETAYKDQYGNEKASSTRVSFSNSASRRGEENSTNESGRKRDSQGVSVSSLYSRLGSYGGVYINRTGDSDFDRVNKSPNLRQVKDNNLIGVYSRGSSYQNNINRNRSIPNLSAIKNDYVREAYRQVRSTNPSQRGNSFSRTSSYDNIGSTSRTQFNNSSTRRTQFNNSSTRSSQGGSSYSSGGVSGGGSKGSSSGSRGGGGKIN
ncbi:MAG: hypothetical protein HOD76_03635 [Cryomorphaceae bacterium]|jgi:hypothetical protein|nr:hypothetical protein [Cryomorphaceae bacterium]MBT4237284.1 hypothetical protein [Cryomorphaceae bacterium]MBT5417429.1 hypothetical protein [Cryomorphaceae bacterium]MBT6224723.1 hypothetical protein [Cryomorphaceae bacterium]MBT6729327.1 hypothetical protein [Cryomorphaceae bacterium]